MLQVHIEVDTSSTITQENLFGFVMYYCEIRNEHLRFHLLDGFFGMLSFISIDSLRSCSVFQYALAVFVQLQLHDHHLNYKKAKQILLSII